MPTRIYNTTTEADLRAALAQGLTIREAAELLGTSPRMTYHCCSVLGLRSGHRGGGVREQLRVPANNPFALTTRG
jgi:hypothetical protein